MVICIFILTHIGSMFEFLQVIKYAVNFPCLMYWKCSDFLKIYNNIRYTS